VELRLLFGVSHFLPEHRRARVALSMFCCFAIIGVLSACNLTGVGLDEGRQPDVLDKVRAVDLSPRPLAQSGDTGATTTPRQRAVVVEGRGTGAAKEQDEQLQLSPGGEGFELNFENTPVTTVAKVILGDILGLGYTIDPRVQGTVSLSSGRPVPKSEMLYALEAVLRINNVVLIRDPTGYRLVPAGEAVGSGNLDRSAAGAEPGYGITVVPLRHVSAATLIKLLENFATRANSVRADPGRNVLIVQGTSVERRAAVEIALSFDADWMRGQSVGIYPVRNSTPEPLIAELEKILDSGEGGLSQNLVKLQPVGRLNAILVVTRKPELLRSVSTWISRLDASDTAAVGVKVYRVRYGDARQMARLLNDIFVIGSGSSPVLDSQTAPGSGSVMTSSGDRPASLGGLAAAPSVGRPALTSADGRAAVGADARNIAPGADIAAVGSRTTNAAGSSLLPGVRITPDTVNNTLLIYANQESYRVIERTLRQLDRPQLQVAIEATIAEVTLNDNLNYGVQFFLKSSDVGLKPDTGSIINSTGGAILARAFPGFNLLVGPAAEPRLILDALHKATNVKVLSNPSVVVLDNQVATLQVGDQIPVTTGTATVLNSANQVVSTIDYRNTGIILRVAPRINSNGNVVLDIEQEISNVSDTSATGTLTPTVSQRRVKSSIAVATGQTVLLAGLISESRSRGRQGLPFIDKIPLLDGVLSSTTNTVQRTELIIFIRPQIIRDSVDAQYVAEQLRTKLTGQPRVATPGAPAAGVPAAPMAR
jgi:general secretion pathway protein D